MSDMAKKYIEKISAYDFINSLIPGTIYVLIIERFTSFTISTDSILFNVILYYFIGVVIGRIGSLLIERILIKGIERVSHTDFVEAENKDDTGKITALSSINNMYRTFVATIVCVLLTVIGDCIWQVVPHSEIVNVSVIVCLCVFLVVVFSKAYRKQTGYIVSRIKRINKVKED